MRLEVTHMPCVWVFHELTWKRVILAIKKDFEIMLPMKNWLPCVLDSWVVKMKDYNMCLGNAIFSHQSRTHDGPRMGIVGRKWCQVCRCMIRQFPKSHPYTLSLTSIGQQRWHVKSICLRRFVIWGSLSIIPHKGIHVQLGNLYQIKCV